jgi:membrane-associated phospholipid phosphatase
LIFVTHIGGKGYIVIIILLVVFFVLVHRNWKFILQTVTVLLLATLSNMALKQVINRARPSLEHLVEVYTLSYPSGHAMSAMGFYGFLVFLVARYKIRILAKVILISLLVFLILSIGISRIYLGVHYPSDVLAGYIGGLLWVTFCAIVFDVIDLWRKRKTRISQLKALDDKK